ncbi:MAG: CBS domain-containing protein [Holosporales bacterium]|jgi:CBS domain containing-hemolysin-like protein|nr:CBS domain-containing protein [Holosporales bacterium]
MGLIELKTLAKKLVSKMFFVKRWINGSSLRNTIEELIEEDSSSEIQSIADGEREILGNVLNLREIQVQNIMVPRVEIEAMQTSVRIEDLIFRFVDTQKSSIIIYKDTIDNVLGVVYLKDIAHWFQMSKPFNVAVFVKEVLFVPPTMRSLDLLFKMKETGIKMAIIVDEYGGVDGLVSFRDIVEEVIGDIQDTEEIRNQKKKVLKSSDGSVIADAKSTFAEINKFGGIKISQADKSIDTIGGLISTLTGRVPVRGELIFCNKRNLEFEILDADPRKVKSVRIRHKC